MPDEPGPGPTGDCQFPALTRQVIDRHMRGLHDSAENPPDRGPSGGRLAMASLALVCLLVGASAREIGRWVLGDTAPGRFTSPAEMATIRFRCSGMSVPGPVRPDGRPDPGGSGNADSAMALPVPRMPGARSRAVNSRTGSP